MLRSRLPARLRRRRPAPLPRELRERLLLIAAAGSPHAAVEPRSSRGIAARGLPWASPLSPLATSFVLALVVSALLGNPYQAGAATVSDLQVRTAPAVARVLDRIVGAASTAVELGRSVTAAVPATALRASSWVTAAVVERLPSDDREENDARRGAAVEPPEHPTAGEPGAHSQRAGQDGQE